MMEFFRSRLALSLTTLMLLAGNGSDGIAQENSLFSSVRASAAFTEVAAGSQQSTQSSVSGRLTSASDLIDWLQTAGFTTSQSGDRAILTFKQLDFWRFPVLVTISDDEQNLFVVMGLRNITDAQRLPTAKLLSLLEANQKAVRASFVFSAERRRIELQTVLANGTEKHREIRDEINRMAILARDLEVIWNLEEAQGGASPSVATASETQAFKATTAFSEHPVIAGPTAAPNTTVPAAPAAVPPAATSPTATPGTAGVAPRTGSAQLSLSSLQGRWVASRSETEVFAMQVNADSTFVLVSVINGKQARSSGKLTLANGQLILEGSDGIRIAGAVNLVSSSELQFSPHSAASTAAILIFRKAP